MGGDGEARDGLENGFELELLDVRGGVRRMGPETLIAQRELRAPSAPAS